MSERRPAGLVQVGSASFSVLDAVGGVRGLVESTIPTLVFTLDYALRHRLTEAVVAAVAVSLLAVLVRLVQRQPVSPAVSGVLAVVVAAGIALYTGSAVNYFLAAIVKNAFFTLVCLVSILVGWPYVGAMLGVVLGEGTGWRAVPERARVYAQATWLWTAMFGLRLGVELFYYLRGSATSLGLLQVPLGLPLFGVVLGLTWLIVRRVPVARPDKDDEGADPGDAVTAGAQDVHVDEVVDPA